MIFLLESTIAIKAPQKAAIFADGLFPFIRLIRVFHLCNSRGVGSAVCPALIQREIGDIEFCVKHRCDDRLLVKTIITAVFNARSEEHTSELQSHLNLVCRLLLEKKKKKI